VTVAALAPAESAKTTSTRATISTILAILGQHDVNHGISSSMIIH
jgi:hypothetical protein